MASIKEILTEGKSDVELTGNRLKDTARLFLALTVIAILVLIPIVAVGYLASK
tara:strand:- start:2065 stop:2223 length:159 start_codon:yes stop_codon:yes gene_type:complete